MIELGFEGLVSDTGLFIWKGESGFIVTIIYVDDALFCRPNKSLVLEFKQKFIKRWETWDLGDAMEFLHMCITQDSSKIHIDQCSYPAIVDTVIDLELQSCYQTIIGSLLCLTLDTHPDIAFAVTKLAQYAAKPTKEYLNKALDICCHLVGIQNYHLTYDGKSGKGLITCTDSD